MEKLREDEVVQRSFQIVEKKDATIADRIKVGHCDDLMMIGYQGARRAY